MINTLVLNKKDSLINEIVESELLRMSVVFSDRITYISSLVHMFDFNNFMMKTAWELRTKFMIDCLLSNEEKETANEMYRLKAAYELLQKKDPRPPGTDKILREIENLVFKVQKIIEKQYDFYLDEYHLTALLPFGEWKPKTIIRTEPYILSLDTPKEYDISIRDLAKVFLDNSMIPLLDKNVLDPGWLKMKAIGSFEKLECQSLPLFKIPALQKLDYDMLNGLRHELQGTFAPMKKMLAQEVPTIRSKTFTETDAGALRCFHEPAQDLQAQIECSESVQFYRALKPEFLLWLHLGITSIEKLLDYYVRLGVLDQKAGADLKRSISEKIAPDACYLFFYMDFEDLNNPIS